MMSEPKYPTYPHKRNPNYPPAVEARHTDPQLSHVKFLISHGLRGPYGWVYWISRPDGMHTARVSPYTPDEQEAKAWLEQVIRMPLTMDIAITLLNGTTIIDGMCGSVFLVGQRKRILYHWEYITIECQSIEGVEAGQPSQWRELPRTFPIDRWEEGTGGLY